MHSVLSPHKSEHLTVDLLNRSSRKQRPSLRHRQSLQRHHRLNLRTWMLNQAQVKLALRLQPSLLLRIPWSSESCPSWTDVPYISCHILAHLQLTLLVLQHRLQHKHAHLGISTWRLCYDLSVTVIHDAIHCKNLPSQRWTQYLVLGTVTILCRFLLGKQAIDRMFRCIG